jgi:hypothetical protein
MNQNTAIIKTSLTTPRAAAIAGIVFSVLLLTSPFDPDFCPRQPSGRRGIAFQQLENG